VIPTRLVVDTNVLVRFFTGQPADMAEAAKTLVKDAEQGKVVLEIVPVIVAETLYTLESYYGLERKTVAQTLLSFLDSPGVRLHEKARLRDALERHRDNNVHFADAYLAATAAELEIAVASFDRDLDRFKDIRRVEPKA
jgi:predicted nucleic acid-binding protein